MLETLYILMFIACCAMIICAILMRRGKCTCRRRPSDMRRLCDRLNDGSLDSTIMLSEIGTKCICGQSRCRRMKNGQCSLDCIALDESGQCVYLNLKN